MRCKHIDRERCQHAQSLMFMCPMRKSVLSHLSRRWDPFGILWGRDGHWPLMMNVGNNSQRSNQAKRNRARAQKMRRRNREEVSRTWLTEFSVSFPNARESGWDEDAPLGPPALQWFLKRRNLNAAARRDGDRFYDGQLLQQRSVIFKDAMEICWHYKRGPRRAGCLNASLPA